MNINTWIAKNCKLANANAYESFVSSLDGLQIVDRNIDREIEPVEEDRFDPGSPYGHYNATVGGMYRNYADFVIKGKVYFPDALLVGGMTLESSIDKELKKDPLGEIGDLVRGWEDLSATYTVVNKVKAGDWYEVVMKAELTGTTPYERE